MAKQPETIIVTGRLAFHEDELQVRVYRKTDLRRLPPGTHPPRLTPVAELANLKPGRTVTVSGVMEDFCRARHAHVPHRFALRDATGEVRVAFWSAPRKKKQTAISSLMWNWAFAGLPALMGICASGLWAVVSQPLPDRNVPLLMAGIMASLLGLFFSLGALLLHAIEIKRGLVTNPKRAQAHERELFPVQSRPRRLVTDFAAALVWFCAAGWLTAILFLQTGIVPPTARFPLPLHAIGALSVPLAAADAVRRSRGVDLQIRRARQLRQ